MFKLEVDVPTSSALLRKLIDATEAEVRKHHRITPGFATSAAGRDFAAHGEALNHVFTALHERNLKLMNEAIAVADAAGREVAVIGESDDRSSGVLGAIEGALPWAR